MIYCRQFIVLLFSIVTFSQFAPTIAVSEQQQCIDETLAFSVTADVDYGALNTLILDKCDGKNNCIVNVEDWSTNGLGGQNFTSMCEEKGGTTVDGNDGDMYTICPSFRVYYPGLYLCVPLGCNSETIVEETWGEIEAKAGFDGECSDYAATPVPTGVVVGVVVVFILICVGVGVYCVRRNRVKSEFPKECPPQLSA